MTTMNLIAEVAGSGMDPAMVGTIIGAVIVALISGGVLGKKVSDSSKTTIDPQPLMVKMQEDFVTRREFDKLETVVAVNAAKSEGYLKQSTDQMERSVATMTKALAHQNQNLSEEIKSVAKGAYEGRQRIHANVNSQGERIAKLEASNGIASELAEVGEKIVEAVKESKKPTR